MQDFHERLGWMTCFSQSSNLHPGFELLVWLSPTATDNGIPLFYCSVLNGHAVVTTATAVYNATFD
jgi:hypothetical protein